MPEPTQPDAAIRVGTSGWHYAHWRKCYYPDGLDPSQWLSYYGREFAAVEVNSSFYGLPEPATVERWLGGVPERFIFALKAPRRITHFKKLKNCTEELDAFLRTARKFGKRLGPLLFQLPPRWRCNTHRLEGFLESLPRGPRYVFEFRDPSWHCLETYTTLQAHNAGFCIFDMRGFTAPLESTANLAYLRLHGPGAAYTGSYRSVTLRNWAAKALAWKARSQDVYVFFDNDERAYAARNARRFITYLTEGARRPGKPVAA